MAQETQDSDTFLGFDKKQIPILALLVAILGVFIAFGGIIIALQMGTRSDMNANHAELRADIRAVNSRVDTLQSVMNANDNALRDDINDLDSRIDILSVEAAETNARIENIERRVENIERGLPDYASVDVRLAELEREQARLADIERELARLNQLVKTLTNSE